MKTVLSVLSVLLSWSAWSQSPGGVESNLKLWLRTDAVSSFDLIGALVEQWRYANDPTKAFVASAPFMRYGGTNSGTLSFDPRPSLLNQQINFQNAVTFFGDQKMDGPIVSDAPITAYDDDYSFFAVWTSTNTGYEGERIWSEWNCSPTSGDQRAGFSFVTGTDAINWNYGAQFEFDPYDQGLKRSYAPNSWYVTQMNVLTSRRNDLQIIDQYNINSPLILSTDPIGGNGPVARHLYADSHNLGTCDGWYRFEGGIAELIIYDRPISGLERSRIFSYLALKYGITLNNFSYVATDWDGANGTIFWQPGTGYDNDIFGIGRDDLSGLFTARSNSINTGSGNGIGQAGRGNIILSTDPANLQDIESLVIGNNGASFASITTDLPVGLTNSQRVTKEWKVRQNGNVGAVNLSFDLNGISVSGNAADVNNFAILIDNDGDGNFTTGTYSMRMPNAITNGRLEFNNLDLPNNVVFTFVTNLRFDIVLNTDWIDFTVKDQENGTQLIWTVTDDATVSHYEVEYRAGNENFKKIAVKTVADTASQVKTYSYHHYSLAAGAQFYRIKRVLKAGAIEYSKIMSISRNVRADINVYPNPFKDNCIIELMLERSDEGLIKLYDQSGRMVRVQSFKGKKGVNQITVKGLEELSMGVYIIAVEGETFQSFKKIIK